MRTAERFDPPGARLREVRGSPLRHYTTDAMARVPDESLALADAVAGFIRREGPVSAREILRYLKDGYGLRFDGSKLLRILALIPDLAEDDAGRSFPVYFYPDWDAVDAFAEEERRRFLAASYRGEDFIPREYNPFGGGDDGQGQ